jgi:hypothetical protein
MLIAHWNLPDSFLDMDSAEAVNYLKNFYAADNITTATCAYIAACTIDPPHRFNVPESSEWSMRHFVHHNCNALREKLFYLSRSCQQNYVVIVVSSFEILTASGQAISIRIANYRKK